MRSAHKNIFGFTIFGNTNLATKKKIIKKNELQTFFFFFGYGIYASRDSICIRLVLRAISEHSK